MSIKKIFYKKEKNIILHQNILIWLSTLFIFFIGSILYISTLLKGIQREKVYALDIIKQRITTIQLDYEEYENVNYKINLSKLTEVKKEFNFFYQVPLWDKYFFPLYNLENKNVIQIILTQTQSFNNIALLPKTYQNEIAFNLVFKNIINQINYLQKSLEKKYKIQQLNINKLQIGLLVIVLIYISLLIISSRKVRQHKNKLLFDKISNLKKIAQNEYFLEESQKIAKLGFYVYDFKTKSWTASKLLLDFVGLNSDKYNLKIWLDIIHLEDRHILTDILEKRLLDPTVILDVNYRIISKKDNEIHWIRHKAPSIKIDFKGSQMPIIGVLQDVTAFVELDKKLIKSEKDLLRSQQIAKIGSFVINISKGTWKNSPMLDAILGIEKEYVKSFKAWFNLIHPEDRDKVYTYFTHIIKNRTKFDLEYRVNHKINNKDCWVHCNGQLIFNAKNIPVKMIGTVQDITESKNKELFKDIIYNISKKAIDTTNLEALFAFIKDEFGKVIYSDNFSITLYDERKDLINTPYIFEKQSDPNSLTSIEHLIKKIIKTKESILINNLNNKRLNKKYICKCFLGVPLLVNGKIIGALAIQNYSDINAYNNDDLILLELIATNVSQTIRHFKDFEQINLLNQALIQSPDAVMITNTFGEIQLINPAFTKHSGYTADEVIGETPGILNSGEQPEDFYKTLWQTIKNGAIYQSELVNMRKDGSKYLVELNISSVKNSTGKITHFIGIEKDITEKRKLERDFINAFIDAQEQEKQNFGEELHDGISQILAAESMFIEVLIKLNQDRINDKTKHLIKIKELNLRAINETRQIAHGLMSNQLNQKGLLITIKDICEDYNHSKNIKFIYSAKEIKEEELNGTIKTNIFRVFQEISTNTLRHSQASKAKIKLSKTKNNQFKFVYEDNGVGIDFDKIRREHRGAGLKNIERRIKLLEGKLLLKSKPNNGVCYNIIVPLQSLM